MPLLQHPLLRQFLMAAPKSTAGKWWTKLSRRELEWREVFLRAVVLAFPSTLPRILEAGPRDRHDRSALVGLGVLLSKTLGSGDSGPKELSNWLRQESVSQFPRFAALRGSISLNGFSVGRAGAILFQLSRFARGGPYPLREKVDDALDQHREDLKKSFSVPRDIRKSVKGFAERWAHGKESSDVCMSYSTSAGFGSTRTSGGWRHEVRTLTNAFRKRLVSPEYAAKLSEHLGPLVRPYTVWNGSWGSEGSDEALRAAENVFLLWEPFYAEDLGLSLEGWELEREFLFSVLAVAWAARSKGFIGGGNVTCRVRRVVVRERGAKARVVTPLEAELAFLGSYLNSWLLGMLSQDPRVDPYEKDISPPFAVAENQYVRSADLTRATDLIPAGITKAIVDGLCAGLCLKGSIVHDLLLVFCRPMLVVEPDGSTWYTRGQPLMGAGPSWPLLSLFNLWLATQSFGNKAPIRTVGDDLLAIGTLAESERYSRLLARTGGSISLGKDTCSKHAGCLVERYCRVNADRTLEWYDTYSVGSFSGRSRVKRDEGTPAFAMGPSLSYAPGVDFLVEVTCKDALRALRSVGIDPYVPREFGGGGFPCSPSRRRLAFKRMGPFWARAIRIAMAQGVRAIPTLHLLQSPWKASGSECNKELETWVKQEVESCNVEFGRARGGGRSTCTLEEFEREIYGRLSPAFDLAYGFSNTRAWSITPMSVKRRLRKVIGEVNGMVPWPRLSDRVRNLEAGFEKFLEMARQETFIIPPVFRASPRIGAARVGP